MADCDDFWEDCAVLREAVEVVALADLQRARLQSARAWLRVKAAELRAAEAEENRQAAIRRLREMEEERGALIRRVRELEA